jgi:HPt (histidine-containing phosphotransfer) domain-containing protein
MDAYLSKPLQAPQLFEVITQLIPLTPFPQEAVPHVRSEEETPASPVLSQERLLARVEGDRALLQEVVGLFFAETPGMQDSIRASIARGDGIALERAAHSVKGAVSSFGAHAARAAALKLESIGRSGDLTHAAPAWAELESEMAQLTRALAVFRREPGQ